MVLVFKAKSGVNADLCTGYSEIPMAVTMARWSSMGLEAHSQMVPVGGHVSARSMISRVLRCWKLLEAHMKNTEDVEVGG